MSGHNQPVTLQYDNTKENREIFVGASSSFRSAEIDAFTAQGGQQAEGRQTSPFQEVTNGRSSVPHFDHFSDPTAKRQCKVYREMAGTSLQHATQPVTGRPSAMGLLESVIDRGPQLPPGTTRDNPMFRPTVGPTALGQPKVLHKASEVNYLGKSKVGPHVTTGDKKVDQNVALSYARVTAGEPRTMRPPDPRLRSDGWRAARDRRNRELMSAVRSQTCIDRNRARFDRLLTNTFHQRQYPELEQNVDLNSNRVGEIKNTFEFLRQSQPKPTGNVVKSVIDTQQLANRSDFLRRKSFVLYTVDVTPTRDAVAEWAETVLHQEMGIKISRRGHLARNCPLKQHRAPTQPRSDPEKDNAETKTGNKDNSEVLDTLKEPVPGSSKEKGILSANRFEVLETESKEENLQNQPEGEMQQQESPPQLDRMKDSRLPTGEEIAREGGSSLPGGSLVEASQQDEEMGESDIGKETKAGTTREGCNTKAAIGSPSRLRTVKQWMRDSYVADYTSTGKVGAALVLKHKWPVMLQGVKGDGTVAWAVVRTESGPLGLASIHGPRNKSQRARLWQWMRTTFSAHPWILGGDWNSVETSEDSVGDSAVQSGAEIQQWQKLTAELDLADGWCAATKRVGPHFTRQKVVGGRLEQARLDRIHYTQMEDWVTKEIQVTHDDSCRMSDHYPVLLQVLKQNRRKRHRTTYFKVNPGILNKDGVKQEIKRLWDQTAATVSDVRIRWELRWKVVRDYLKLEQGKETLSQKAMQAKIESLQQQLRSAAAGRCKVADDRLTELLQEARSLLEMLDKSLAGSDPARLILIATMAKSIWLDRNGATYAARRSTIPIRVVLKQTENVLEALRTGAEPHSKQQEQFQIARISIQQARARCSNHSNQLADDERLETEEESMPSSAEDTSSAGSDPLLVVPSRNPSLEETPSTNCCSVTARSEVHHGAETSRVRQSMRETRRQLRAESSKDNAMYSEYQSETG
ncbi:hypothetical protein R1sor_012406 [Riccia sorocarpa]|uniref:Endonuclease/exonuclease/phosphatase domain-containing protein n=1 Tax=Riccia sorocarpa TaxID=122646 RepID=A0ABD3I7G7_9MARC